MHPIVLGRSRKASGWPAASRAAIPAAMASLLIWVCVGPLGAAEPPSGAQGVQDGIQPAAEVNEAPSLEGNPEIAPGAPPMFAAAVSAGPVLTTLPAAAAQTAPGGAPGRIVRLVAVGMVLTEDGTIWVYRPDQRRWMTIDQSFQEEGQETRILPLPVRPQAIREMVTWGFLLTDAGECWLYQVDNHRWDRLPAPRR